MLAIACANAAAPQAPSQCSLPVPPTRTDDVRDTLHGVVIPDPYRWLEDQQAPATRAWIDAQNRYAHACLDSLPGTPGLERRLSELLRVTRTDVPVERGGIYFYTKRRPRDEQAILYMRNGSTGRERVFLDPNSLSADHSISAGYFDLSPSGSLAAYYLRAGGDDRTTIRIRDVRAGRDLPDSLPRDFIDDFSFRRDESGYYYIILKPLVGRRVFYHAIGTPPARDSMIFGEGYGPDAMFGVSTSENGKHLIVGVYHGWARSDIFAEDLATHGPLLPVVRDSDALFDARFAGDRLFVMTDWHAPRKRIMEVLPGSYGPGRWKEVVPEGPEPIEDWSLAGGRIFVQYLRNVHSRIAVFSADGTPAGDVHLPGPGSATVPAGRWQSGEAFFQYSSFVYPPVVNRLLIRTGHTGVWARTDARVTPSEFETRQVWFTSKDGARVPMFLVMKRGLPLDGKRPVYLTGYGGFDVSMVPQFSPIAVVWAEHGGVFALPNLRGGEEFGTAWHEAGMGEKKQNVFDDFIAAAEWLIANHVSRPRAIGIEGESNGGLLVGAAMTQRPELFGAVVCEYPLLDMLRYHLFLQGPQWVPEYGSAADPAQFRTLYAYSPYHHVRQGIRYPSTLFETGDADTRVAPLHARKMTALLQALADPRSRFLLHYDTEAGHSGGQPVGKRIQDGARVLSFLLWQIGAGGE